MVLITIITAIGLFFAGFYLRPYIVKDAEKAKAKILEEIQKAASWEAKEETGLKTVRDNLITELHNIKL